MKSQRAALYKTTLQRLRHEVNNPAFTLHLKIQHRIHSNKMHGAPGAQKTTHNQQANPPLAW